MASFWHNDFGDSSNHAARLLHAAGHDATGSERVDAARLWAQLAISSARIGARAVYEQAKQEAQALLASAQREAREPAELISVAGVHAQLAKAATHFALLEDGQQTVSDRTSEFTGQADTADPQTYERLKELTKLTQHLAFTIGFRTDPDSAGVTDHGARNLMAEMESHNIRAGMHPHIRTFPSPTHPTPTGMRDMLEAALSRLYGEVRMTAQTSITTRASLVASMRICYDLLDYTDFDKPADTADTDNQTTNPPESGQGHSQPPGAKNSEGPTPPPYRRRHGQPGRGE